MDDAVSCAKLDTSFWNELLNDDKYGLQEREVDLFKEKHEKSFLSPFSRSIDCYRSSQQQVFQLSQDNNVKFKLGSTGSKTKLSNSSCTVCSTSSKVLPIKFGQLLDQWEDINEEVRDIRAKERKLAKQKADLQQQVQAMKETELENVAKQKALECKLLCKEKYYTSQMRATRQRLATLENMLDMVNKSLIKWKGYQKELEDQVIGLDQLHLDIREKKCHKEMDSKLLDEEIANLRISIACKITEIDKTKETIRHCTDNDPYVKSREQINRIKAEIDETKETRKRVDDKSICDTQQMRKILKQFCDQLLVRRLENEDLSNEIQMIQYENDRTSALMKDKVQLKIDREKQLWDEIGEISKQIKYYQPICTRCPEKTSTEDLIRFCTDCPKCMKDHKICIVNKKGLYCTENPEKCTCTKIKMRLCSNIFENMRMILERQAQTNCGKALSGIIYRSLLNSLNAKLDKTTQHVVQDFVLSCLKQNINFSIVGGAVKTKCEMDPDTYKHLMACLKGVPKSLPAEKLDKSSQKAKPCLWGCAECYCRKCVCSKHAPFFTSKIPDEETLNLFIKCPFSKTNEPCGSNCSFPINDDICMCPLKPENPANPGAAQKEKQEKMKQEKPKQEKSKQEAEPELSESDSSSQNNNPSTPTNHCRSTNRCRSVSKSCAPSNLRVKSNESISSREQCPKKREKKKRIRYSDTVLIKSTGSETNSSGSDSSRYCEKCNSKLIKTYKKSMGLKKEQDCGECAMLSECREQPCKECLEAEAYKKPKCSKCLKQVLKRVKYLRCPNCIGPVPPIPECAKLQRPICDCGSQCSGCPEDRMVNFMFHDVVSHRTLSNKLKSYEELSMVDSNETFYTVIEDPSTSKRAKKIRDIMGDFMEFPFHGSVFDKNVQNNSNASMV